PGSNRVASAATVGDGPAAVAAGSGRIWVASYRDGTLWEYDPKAGTATKVPAIGRPFALAIDRGSVYVGALGPGQFTGNVTQFDAVTGGRGGGLERLVCSLASGPVGIWVAGCPDVERLV